ncbi:hypothetical protein [Hyphomicrobium sp. ghe19]|uniref:hypothetical protein n=1 Tax=Hyphomicrobium sp. ghe19 TaxID=2682968 RepID=UPI0030CD04BB
MIPRQLLDQYHPEESDPTYRMSMLPFGTYPNADGQGEHLGFAMPGMIQEPINALMRLGQNSRFDDGRLGIPNPENLDNQHDTATLIESLFGGNATRGAGATVESAAAHALPETPTAIRAYHGTGAPITGDKFDAALSKDIGPHFGTPEQANNFALRRSDREGNEGTVYPADLHFQNPVELPDQYTWQPWKVARTIEGLYPQYAGLEDRVLSAPHEAQKAEFLQALNDHGIDGIKYHNAMLGEGVGPSYIATKPGTVTSPLTGETLFSDTGKPSILGAAVAGAERPGFDVWHGSPHDFDKFDLSKIGTGEGNQAFGHGLYFAEHPSVAKEYQAALSGDDPGYLYQARVATNPDQFMDLDKALSEQPESVRNALMSEPVTAAIRDMYSSHAYPSGDGFYVKTPGGSSGGFRTEADALTYMEEARSKANAARSFADYNAPYLMASFRDKPAMASAMKEAGIPGVRYLDSGSREGGTASHNYVVFDDNLVDTLHKWRGDQQLYSGGPTPSLWGNALSQDQNDPRNSFFNY